MLDTSWGTLVPDTGWGRGVVRDSSWGGLLDTHWGGVADTGWD